MEMWIIWLIVAAALVIVEVMSQQFWTLCLAVGCVASMACALFGMNIVWQMVSLSMMSVVAFAALMPLFKRWHEKKYADSPRDHRTGMDALLGRRAEVVNDIRPGETGRVRIDGDYWQARAPHIEEVIPKGCEVVVDAYDSIILTVQPQ